MKQSSLNCLFAVGLDVGKADLHAALMDENDPSFLAEEVFSNDKKGFLGLLSWLKKRLPKGGNVHACMEATGSYSQALALFLAKHLDRVSVVNPQCIKAFGQIGLRRSKTDPADARLIARFCLKEKPESWQPPSPKQQKLTALARRIANLQSQQTAENNRLGQCLEPEVAKSLRSHLRWLKAEERNPSETPRKCGLKTSSMFLLSQSTAEVDR